MPNSEASGDSKNTFLHWVTTIADDSAQLQGAFFAFLLCGDIFIMTECKLCFVGVVPSPFDHSDVVTTTTHKSLRGPRGAMIFYRKGVRKVTKKGVEVMYDIDKKIDFSVFPGLQVQPRQCLLSCSS